MTCHASQMCVPGILLFQPAVYACVRGCFRSSDARVRNRVAWRISYRFCKEVACSHSADVSARAVSKVSRVSDILWDSSCWSLIGVAVVCFRSVTSWLHLSKLRVDVISIVFDARATMSVGLRDFNCIFTASVIYFYYSATSMRTLCA